MPTARSSAEATRKRYPKCGAGRGEEDGDSDMSVLHRVFCGDTMKRVWMRRCLVGFWALSLRVTGSRAVKMEINGRGVGTCSGKMIRMAVRS